MQDEIVQTDFDDYVEEKVIQKISPDSSSHYKPECPCGCHLLAGNYEKSYVIVPIRQNGSIIDIVKLPIFKIKKQPKKTLLGYAKCKLVPINRNCSEQYFPVPMWSVQESDMVACFTCKERQGNMQSGRQGNLQVKSDMSSQTEHLIREESFKKKLSSESQIAGPSQIKRESSVREQIPEEPEEEMGRISYEEYRTGFGQWYPFFINKPKTRRVVD